MIDAARQNQLARAEQPQPPAIIQTSPAIRHGGSDIHLAYCKAAAGIGATIVCYLDTDGTGEEITVYCTLFLSSDLNNVRPLLTDGQPIPVAYYGEQWNCLWWFMAGEECP